MRIFNCIWNIFQNIQKHTQEKKFLQYFISTLTPEEEKKRPLYKQISYRMARKNLLQLIWRHISWGGINTLENHPSPSSTTFLQLTPFKGSSGSSVLPSNMDEFMAPKSNCHVTQRNKNRKEIRVVIETGCVCHYTIIYETN